MKNYRVAVAALIVASVLIALAGVFTAPVRAESIVYDEGIALVPSPGCVMSRDGLHFSLKSGSCLFVLDPLVANSVTVECGDTRVSGVAPVFQLETVRMEGQEYLLVNDFAGSIQISHANNNQQAELVSGKAMLVCQSDAQRAFVFEDELDPRFWSSDSYDSLSVGQNGVGSSFIPIPYERLSGEVLDALIGYGASGHSLPVSAEVLQRLRTVGHYYLQTVLHASDCTQDGLSQFDCAFCGASYQMVIESQGHLIGMIPAVEPTCTEDGKTGQEYCSRCGETVSGGESIPALGHIVEIDPAVEPTCTQEGLTEGTHCSVCNAVVTEQKVIPMLPHQVITDYGWDAICTETGMTEGSHCAVCRTVLVEQTEIPMLPHQVITDAGFEANCTETGMTEGSHCGVCNQILTVQETIPAKGHTEEIVPGIPVSCTADGLTEGIRCTVCGTVLKNQEKIPAGHRPAQNTVVSTSYADDTVCYSNIRFCEVCGLILERENISHNADGEHREPCESGCYRAVLSCTVCGRELDSRVVDHVPFETVANDEATGQELIINACSVCGKILSQRNK